MKEKLNVIVSWLNNNYNQKSENYDIFIGSKPRVIKYDEHTAISLWACGAIVCIGSILYFIGEDDGNWFLIEGEEHEYGLQNCFSIGWAKSFVEAMNILIKYVEENGKPICYSGTDIICNYIL